MADTAPAAEASTDIAVTGQPLRTPRRYGAVNWLGVWTLYKREVGRFLKVATQTLFAPVLSVVLFMIVFKLAYPERGDLQFDGLAGGVAFNDFIAPGLIMMAILNNAFQNSSSSLTISKVQGSQVDFLMPPLSPMELSFGFIAGAATRGAVCALLTALVIYGTGLASFSLAHVWPILYFGLTASVMLGAIGAMGGIWADKFDHLAAVSQFVILPLTFLSGTFYRIEALNPVFEALSHANPFFYLIDGFRYGFIGAADGNLTTGVIVCGLVALACAAGVWLMFRTGYKLKA